MTRPSEPLEHRRYEAEVMATVWREQDYLERVRGIRLEEACLVGQWPSTEVRVRWQHAGRDGEITRAIYDPGGRVRAAADDVGADVLDLIMENT
jgi:hypothetical protein